MLLNVYRIYCNGNVCLNNHLWIKKLLADKPNKNITCYILNNIYFLFYLYMYVYIYRTFWLHNVMYKRMYAIIH